MHVSGFPRQKLPGRYLRPSVLRKAYKILVKMEKNASRKNYHGMRQEPRNANLFACPNSLYTLVCRWSQPSVYIGM